MLSINLPTTISYMIITLLCTSLESSPSLYTEQYTNDVDRVPVQVRYPRRYRTYRTQHGADSLLRTATLCEHTIFSKWNMFHAWYCLMTTVQISFGLRHWRYFGSQNASWNHAELDPNDPSDDLPPLGDI